MGRNNFIKNTSRLMAALLALTLLLSVVPAVCAAESGTCGDNLNWNLSAGTLTITGSGAMTDFNENELAPWSDLRDQIIRLVLPDGLTSVGSMAFYDCRKIVSVVIPDSVTVIGDYAFAHCEAMEMLDLSCVRSVGKNAFSSSYSLKSLRLPDTLETIGTKAFYRCESISTITVPASVTSLGASAFGYCKSLVSADVRASISQIPELLFYGCEMLASVNIAGTAGDFGEYAFRGCDALNTVYHDGSRMTSEEIREMVKTDISGFSGNVSQADPSDTVSSGITGKTPDGIPTQENTTVSQGKDSTVVSTTVTTHPKNPAETEFTAEIVVTVEKEEGWDDVQSAVEDALWEYNNGVASMGTEYQPVDIYIYVSGQEEIDPDFLDGIAGQNVNITVKTADGSVWRINGMDLVNGNHSVAGMNYTITAGSQELCAELGVDVGFALQFLFSAQVNAEVIIGLGTTHAYQEATLFQRTKNLQSVQTVVVDDNGYAHFYLGAVDDETEYYIGINVQQEQAQQAIVPEALYQDYGITDQGTGVEYVITGRQSSWGMNINQVTWIMIGGMTAVVVTVGFVMYLLNKRKLRMGYVPDLDEEFE